MARGKSFVERSCGIQSAILPGILQAREI
jgi:hypothetical protein